MPCMGCAACSHSYKPCEVRHCCSCQCYAVQSIRRPSHTFFFVLQKMTACVMVSVSYRSHSVSNFHSSFSTATKNCLMPCKIHSRLITRWCLCTHILPNVRTTHRTPGGGERLQAGLYASGHTPK